MCQRADSTDNEITIEMIEAGVKAYADYLGDSRPVQMPGMERELVAEIYCAMCGAREGAIRT
jgi:hypothetical protein